MTARTHFFAEYMFSDITYKENKYNNSVSNRLAVGVNGHIASKVTGTAKVTYEMRDYDHSIQHKYADKYNDLVGYYVALTYTPTTRDILRLSGERRMEETRFTAAGGTGYNRFFADTVVSLHGAHKLTDKFTAALTLAWENMNYAKRIDGIKRNDDLYTIRPELDYQFKDWLSAGVWYQFRTRHSNWNRAQYDNNKAGVFVKAVF